MTDPRFVRLCGEQSDILLNSVISRKHRAYTHFVRTSICNPEGCGERTVINCMQAGSDKNQDVQSGRF